MKIIYILIVALPMMAAYCKKENENCHFRIRIQNNSVVSIYTGQSYSYPDTTDYRYFPFHSYIESGSYKLGKDESTKIAASHAHPWTTCWEDVFRSKISLPSDTLIMFFFDAERIEQAPKVNGRVEWSDDMLLRRYDLSLDDLRRLDFQLHYPPTEAMRNMKMYPAYGK